MKMKKLIYRHLVIALVIIANNANAQLKEACIDNNYSLKIKHTINHLKNISINDTLNLPFIDDFAYPNSYPSNELWLDSNVFINDNYADTPIFRGVATFDCLDKNGNLYTNTNSFTFVADTLTSKPINLNYLPQDSVFISFFIQPQGLAYDRPEERDSLVLKIKTPNTNWESLWNIGGSSVYPFKQVLIPITDTLYLKKGTQIMFINYASVSSDLRSSNGDYWNLDYVHIDKNRSINDTSINDVGFVTLPKSYVKDYYSIPCKHMLSTYDAKSNEQSYRNYGELAVGFDRKIYSTNIYNSQTQTRNLSTVDLNPHQYHIFPFIYTITLFDYHDFDNEDTAEYNIKSVLLVNSGANEQIIWNDTAYFNQKFYNYYALDDGTPEAGIGMDGEESYGAKLAVKFYTIKPDTLQSVRFWFNKTNDNVNQGLAFDLLVWDNNNGIPGNIIYEQDTQITNYSNNSNDNYVDYILEAPFILTDTFFIGFRQNHENFMNLGFDKNYDNSTKTFYSFGNWEQSTNKGSIMIRPVFGDRLKINVPELTKQENIVEIYPNPTTNKLNIKSTDSYILKIYNQIGSLIEIVENKNIIDVSNYSEGLYFLNFNTNNTSITKKLIIKK